MAGQHGCSENNQGSTFIALKKKGLHIYLKGCLSCERSGKLNLTATYYDLHHYQWIDCSSNLQVPELKVVIIFRCSRAL